MMQRLVFLKQGLSLSLFIYFLVFHFYVQKLFYSLQKCIIHLKKKFLWHLDFMKKVVLCCLKMRLCICKICWCVGLGQERGCLHEGGGNCMKYLKRGRIGKRGGETKNLKWGKSWIKGWVS